MIFEAIIITWSIIFMLWTIFSIQNIINIKKIQKELLFLPNLYFIAEKQTQEYFLNNSIKLDDIYFDDLIKIISKQRFIYKKAETALDNYHQTNFNISIWIAAFGLLVPIAYGEFKFDKLADNSEYITYLIWFLFFILSNWVLVFAISLGYLLSIFYQLKPITSKITLENIQEWKDKNQKLNNEITFVSLNEFLDIYKQISQPKKILINRGNRVWYTFKFNIEYTKRIQEFFENPERYLYFISVLPYDNIKINYKRVEGYFTSWL